MDHFFIEKQNILFSYIDHLLTRKERIFLAIDGPCTAGKTTLAAVLQKTVRMHSISYGRFFPASCAAHTGSPG